MPDKSCKILDVGCGIGTIAKLLKDDGHDVTGIDFSSVAVNKAKQLGIHADVVDVDKEGLPFEDGEFDIVYAGDIVEHVFDPINLMKESVRVLAPSGQFVFSVPNDITLRRRIKIFVKGISPQTEVYREYIQCKHHTVFSMELLQYFISTTNMTDYKILGITKNPYFGSKHVIRNYLLSSLFARTFAVSIKK